MQPLAISQECLYFHKKFGCIYALTSYFCPVCIVRCISSCHILFHFFKEGHWGVFFLFVLSPQAFGVNSIVLGDNSKAYGDNSKAYGDNSKGYGDRIDAYKKV